MKLLFTLLLVFFNVPIQAEPLTIKDLKKVHVAIKINKYGTRNTLSTLQELKKYIDSKGGSGPVSNLIDPDSVFFDSFLNRYPPTNPNLSGTASSKTLKGISVGLGVVSFDLETIIEKNTNFDRALTDQEKRESLNLATELVNSYGDLKLKPNEKKIVDNILAVYLNFDLNQKPEDDLDLIEFNSVAQQFSSLESFITEQQKDTEDKLSVLDYSIKHLTNKIQKLNSQTVQDSKVQKNLLNSMLTNEQFSSERIERKIDALYNRSLKKDFRENLLRQRDPAAIQREIEKISRCSQGSSDSICQLPQKDLLQMKEQAAVVKDELVFDIKIGAAKNIASSLTGIGVMFDDPRLVELGQVIDKTTFVVESFDKMSDLLDSALASGGLVALGDVTSMVNIATGVLGVFQSASASPESIMIKQLQQIQKAIEKLQMTMEKEFKNLNKKIDDLGISVNAQFQILNSNVLVVNQKVDDILAIFDSEFVDFNNYVELAERVSIRNKLDGMRIRINEINIASDQDLIAEYFNNLLAQYEAYLDTNDVQLNWKKLPKDSAELVDHLHMAFLNTPLSTTSSYEWLSTMARIANFSGHVLSNEVCNDINTDKILNFNLYTRSFVPAFKLEYSDTAVSHLKEKNKFQNYIKYGKIETHFFDKIKNSYLDYKNQTQKLESCLSSYFPISGGNTSSLFTYLIEQNQLQLNTYIDAIKKIFKEDQIFSSFSQAIRITENGVFPGMSDKAQNLEISRRHLLKLNRIFTFSEFLGEKPKKSLQDLVVETLPEIPSCDQKSEALKTPVKLLLKTFPKKETWQSIYLGLNGLKVCYNIYQSAKLYGYISYYPVFSLSFQIDGFPESSIKNGTYSFTQVYRTMLNDAQGEWIEKQEIIYDSPKSHKPGPKPEDLLQDLVVHDAKYFKFEQSFILNQLVETGKILEFNNHCFDHKETIFYCYPTDFEDKKDRTYYLGWGDSFLKTSDFITSKGEEGLKSFNQFNIDSEDIKTYVDIATSNISECVMNLVMTDEPCEFRGASGGKQALESLRLEPLHLKPVKKKIDQIHQILRVVRDGLIFPKSTSTPESVKIFNEDLDLLMMTPEDVLLMAMTESGNLGDALEKLQNDLNDGFRDVIQRSSTLVELNLDAIFVNPAFLDLEQKVFQLYPEEKVREVNMQ